MAIRQDGDTEAMFWSLVRTLGNAEQTQMLQAMTQATDERRFQEAAVRVLKARPRRSTNVVHLMHPIARETPAPSRAARAG